MWLLCLPWYHGCQWLLTLRSGYHDYFGHQIYTFILLPLLLFTQTLPAFVGYCEYAKAPNYSVQLTFPVLLCIGLLYASFHLLLVRLILGVRQCSNLKRDLIRLMYQQFELDGVDEKMGLDCVQQTFSRPLRPTSVSYRLW
jgi:hypothetical protein